MIGLYLHHHGSGHRTRGTLIAQELCRIPGVEVTGLGTGAAPPGWPGAWVDLVRDDDRIADDLDAVGPDVSAGEVLHWAPLRNAGLVRRQRQLVTWLDEARPSVVLVDVSVEVALQTRLCGIPVVVTALPGDRTDRPHTAAYDLAEQLIAPWPVGTHERDWPVRWRAKTCHVGGISRFAGLSLPPPTTTHGPGRRRVLSLWGAGGTQVGPAQLEAAQAATPGWSWTHRGGPHAASPDLWAELAEADVVVTHAGQNSVADVACARRPAVVVAQDRPHGEQYATARAVEQVGAATGLAGWPSESDRWPGLLEQAVQRGGSGWAAWQEPGAAARVAALLKECDDVASRVPA